MASLAAGDGVAEAVDEEQAVGQSGQGGVQGLVGQLLLGILAFCDVADVDDVAPHRRTVAHVGDDGLGVAPRPVAVLHAELEGLDEGAGAQELHQFRLDACPVVGRVLDRSAASYGTGTCAMSVLGAVAVVLAVAAW